MSDFFSTKSNPRRQLGAALKQGMVIAPGVYDGVTARLVEATGFDAAYFTGFGAAASLLGQPDIGLLTESEMSDALRRICAAVKVPIIADADTGYGGVPNVIRAVRAYEQAGVSAIQLEDQVFPKRCGHMNGKSVIPIEEATAKLRAAVAARHDDDLMIIARTDVAAIEGVPAAIDRAKRFADAGADMLFVEAPPSRADVEAVARALSGHRLLFNWVEGGKSAELNIDLLRDLGFDLVIFPISTLLVAAHAMRGLLESMKETSSSSRYSDRMDRFDDFVNLMGLAEIRQLEESFLHPHADQSTARDKGLGA